MNNNQLTKVTNRGSVLIVGGGIGGMQAALDLAESGFKVHMVQKDSSIGGTMVMLDKTFPTGDCSMCMSSPKMVEIGRHLNIDLHVLAEIISIEGNSGDFKVKVKQQPHYVDPEKCTGCGICEEKCPKKLTSEYEQGLTVRKAIYSLFPQALPNTRVIDRENCIYFQKGKCKACEKFCTAGAILWEDTEKEIVLDVGAIILSPGLERYDPFVRQELGFGRWPNVVTSIQFERILSASGPYEGTVMRPGDKKHPKKVAWIQCVGSRDFHNANPWCSSVCCMYATKQAMIAKEHDQNIEPTIFYIDLRAFGKDFDKYVIRAEEDYGVRYQRAMISAVREEPGTGNLILRYAEPDGKLTDETFDMVVLSIGFQPHSDAVEFSKIFDIELDKDTFVKTSSFKPVETTRPGIYVTGIYQGPKDIPETVMQGSAVAGKVMELLSDVRGTEIKIKEILPERDVKNEEPRIGVFVCRCGFNIAGTIDIEGAVACAKALPHVTHAGDFQFACSKDSQDKMKEVIEKEKLNRIVVAACSPRTHEVLFQETLVNVGINKYLFEMANIRNQCSWVHSHDKQGATEKAKDLIRMAVSKADLLDSLYEHEITMNQSALVIGGGLAGMTAAMNLADQGYHACLIEKSHTLGGQALQLHKTWQGDDVQKYLAKLIHSIESNPNLDVLLNTELKKAEGFVGNFQSIVETEGNEQRIDHGVAIIATGATEFKPNQYLYGEDPRVLTALELDQKFIDKDSSLKDINSAIFIQCVGSRNKERPYCSKVCCTHAVQSALELKTLNPDMNIFILYRDIRTFGRWEERYREAREIGIIFIRYDLDKEITVDSRQNGLEINFICADLQQGTKINSDLLILSTAMLAPLENPIAQLFKLPVNEDGFFVEAHVKLRPMDFATDGVFVCGLAHSPKPMDESISQGLGAASRAVTLLSKEKAFGSAIISKPIDENCDGCAFCIDPCPYNALTLLEYMKGGDVKKTVETNDVICKGCGSCMATCPKQGIFVSGFTMDQLNAQVVAALEQV